MTPSLPIERGTEVADQRNWFERNWKWFVPLGCLTLLIVFLALVGTFVYFMLVAIGSSEVAEIAVRHAVDHPRVHAVLGAPVENRQRQTA